MLALTLYAHDLCIAHTSRVSWAGSFHTSARDATLSTFVATAKAALDVGLVVNAGHDLNRENLTPFLKAVPGVAEVSIGHALIGDALELGYERTVRAYLDCIEAAFPPI